MDASLFSALPLSPLILARLSPHSLRAEADAVRTVLRISKLIEGRAYTTVAKINPYLDKLKPWIHIIASQISWKKELLSILAATSLPNRDRLFLSVHSLLTEDNKAQQQLHDKTRGLEMLIETILLKDNVVRERSAEKIAEEMRRELARRHGKERNDERVPPIHPTGCY